MPMQDAQEFDVMTARLLDGSPLSIREQDPLFVMDALDAAPVLRRTFCTTRPPWQLRHIEVI